MKKYISIIATALVLAACGNGSDLDAKKEEVSALRDQINDLKQQITTLEEEIKAEDPTYGVVKINAVLVTAKKMLPEYFEHKVEVRGSVQSRTNVTVTSEIPGIIQKVKVTEGQYVKKGDLLFALDADIIKNNVAELQTSLELATIVAQKQENLYNQNVGTEIQYLQAKNNKESLERRLATAKSQLAQARIRAPFSGTIDQVNAKVGEMANPGVPLVRIVNQQDMHIKSDVSERFIGKFKKGDDVEVYFPTLDKRLVSKVSAVGQVVNQENRTFEIEVKLPSGLDVRPNQVAVLNLRDYLNNEALVVPTKLIQRDRKGQYVYELVNENNKKVAKKLYVEPGITYDGITELTKGVRKEQLIAMKGYRDLAQGVVVEIQGNPEENRIAGNTSN